MSDRRTVSVARCAAYSLDETADALASLLGPLGGMPAYVPRDSTVLLKVNLLMRAEPEAAVTTHPELVRAVIRSAAGAGAREIQVGDSPGGQVTPSGMAALLETTGIGRVCREEGVRFISLDEDPVRVRGQGARLYPAFDVGGAVERCDVLVNLPKLKTHGFMMFTGAVKNLFGCIPGLGKAQFHVKVPDRDDFANMLLDLLLACRPALNIMDAVVAHEGQGPSGGSPRPLGLLLASSDAVALDVIAAAIAGFGPAEVYTNRAAARRGLGPATPDEVPTVGVPWREVVHDDFARPARDPIGRVPPSLARWARARTAARPLLERRADCTGCATCADACPVEAIEMRGDLPVFDERRCIRCYCCQELCPSSAIGLRTPLLARAMLAMRPRTGR